MRSTSCPRFFFRRFAELALLFFFACTVSCAGRPDAEPTNARGNGTGIRSVTMPREGIASVLSRRTPMLMDIEGVKGTGEGREGADTVLLVFVVRKTEAVTARIPREVDGWRVVIREVGEITAPPR